jgi:hypothetical protein
MSQEPLGSSGVRGRTIYFPAIPKARLVKQFSIVIYHAILVTDCESVGGIYYDPVIFIREAAEPEPLLAMASEIADVVPDTGERFMCMFYHGMHYNFGSSSDWLDIEKFTDKALNIALNHLSVFERVQELPIDTETGGR